MKPAAWTKVVLQPYNSYKPNGQYFIYILDEAIRETLRQAFISVDKEYFESIGKFVLDGNMFATFVLLVQIRFRLGSHSIL